jgi:TolA-binding protein
MSYILAATTVFNLLCAGISAWVAFQALTQYYRINNRVESVEDKLESALGKMHRNKGITRDTIRDQVDTYLGTLDLQSGGGMDGEIMQMMMAQMMGGAMGGEAPSEPSPEEARETAINNGTFLGSGGNDG